MCMKVFFFRYFFKFINFNTKPIYCSTVNTFDFSVFTKIHLIFVNFNKICRKQNNKTETELTSKLYLLK